MRIHVVATFGVLLLAFSSQACGGAQSSGAESPESAEDPDAPKTLIDDEAWRAQLKTDLEAAIDTIDLELKALGDRIEAGAEDSEESLETERGRLQERRDALADALRRLNVTAAEAGNDVRQEVQNLLQDLGISEAESEE